MQKILQNKQRKSGRSCVMLLVEYKNIKTKPKKKIKQQISPIFVFANF